MQHLINRQTIHLHLENVTDAFRTQQLVSEHYWQEVVPMLTSLFDEISSDDEVIRMDRLELDLGRIKVDELRQTRWSAEFLSKIRDQLYDKIVSRFKSGLLVIREATPISVCKQWLSYMEKGYLPWNVVRIDDGWYNKVLETLAVDFTSVNELRRMIRSNPVMAKRISLQYKDDFLLKLIEILTSHNQQNLPRMIEVLRKIVLRTNEVALTSKKISFDKAAVWSLLIQRVAESESQLNSQKLLEMILIQYLPAAVILDWKDDGNTLEYRIVQPIFEKLKKEGIRWVKERQKIDRPIHDVLFTEKNAEIKVTEQIDRDGIFIQHAGVALVHPFLSSLFKHLQITEGGRFKNDELQRKALFLLHYIATGRTTAEEYELTFAKILCDWPLEMPIRNEMDLSSEELAEADEMLEVAIKQWSVLKNTSVDGLREGFLRRSGKLFTRNDQLYLRVEAQPIDVLLDQLPWVLSMIKLPWMKELLRVEWR